MKRWLILCLGISFGARANLESDLKKIANSYKIPHERLGLFVTDMNAPGHPVVLDLNGEKNFIPASVSKVVTATAILQKFGPSYKFTTELLGDAKVEGDTLGGSLYLKGGGDPGFVSETMWFLVNDFYRSGIKQVGDVVVDDSLFDSVRFDESRDPERNDRAYDAPVGAMSFNWNAINVFVRPTTPGKPAGVFLDPEMQGWSVSNKARTSEGKTDVRVTRGDGETVFVDGKIAAGAPEFVSYKNVHDPALYSGQALRAFLLQRGIKVTGTIRTGKTPAGARQLAKAEGKPISALVSDMMKFSNNFVAEMLTKDLAAKFVKTPGSLADGVEVIRKTILEMGLKPETFHFQNPSGLSRKNSFKPRDLVYLLSENYKQFSYAPEYLSALPLAGIDGTLRRRFKKEGVAGWIRAKTGHLTGVGGLAGYAGQKDGGVFAYAFIFNGPPEQSELASRLFDALASELVQ